MAKKNKDWPYQVFNPHGEIVLQATADARYSRLTEQTMLENGYTIKLNGRKLTKKELKNGSTLRE